MENEYGLPEMLASIWLTTKENPIDGEFFWSSLEDLYDLMETPLENRSDFESIKILSEANFLFVNIIKKLNQDEFDDYIKSVGRAISIYGHSNRQGQIFFNVLYKMHPILADSLRGNPEIDPFYNDENLVSFITYICEREIK